jgi:hypothetical protein
MSQAILAQAQACPLLPTPIASPLVWAICRLQFGDTVGFHVANASIKPFTQSTNQSSNHRPL